MTTAAEPSQRTLALRGGQFEIALREGGAGSPVVFLHGFTQEGWEPLLAGLAENHRVIAPSLPGSSGGSGGLDQLLDHHDLFFLYQEILDALRAELGVESIALVGHSFGGWLAAELAAVEPARVSALALIAPFGLWDDAKPIADTFTLLPQELSAASFHDDNHPLAVALRDSGEGDAEKRAVQVRRARDNSSVARFIWPIPDKGLARRLHRVQAPTLLIWGDDDRIVPPAYAGDFAALLTNSRRETIAAAGHLPQAEQPAATLAALRGFLPAS